MPTQHRLLGYSVGVPKVLIFGSQGSVGSACVKVFEKEGWQVASGHRDFDANLSPEPFQGIVWAQGRNLNASFAEISESTWNEIFESNFFFVVRSLRFLLENQQIGPGARLVVVGSVWEKVHRKMKAPYIASKSAISGLTRALASDLSDYKIAINCVSPGVLLSPMTSSNLSSQQIQKILNETPTGKLVTIEDISQVILFLVSSRSNGINGQSIVVDNGWSGHRDV